MYPQDEELHAELMKLFREYFQENQVWMAEATKQSSIRLRNHLNAIRHLCIKRRAEVLRWQRDKTEQLAERKARRYAQKKGKGK